MASIRLIIGLGNPGQEYENTYHNAGIQFVEYALREENHEYVEGIKIVFSEVFMNQSGAFVQKVLKKFGATPEELLIVHDDSDLALGTVKISFARGSAGHHGVESIMASLNTDRFYRLRIGIRPAEEKIRSKAGSFVLKKIKPQTKLVLERIFKETLLKIPTISGEVTE